MKHSQMTAVDVDGESAWVMIEEYNNTIRLMVGEGKTRSAILLSKAQVGELIHQLLWHADALEGPELAVANKRAGGLYDALVKAVVALRDGQMVDPDKDPESYTSMLIRELEEAAEQARGGKDEKD